jgi:hypothetical protein
MRSHVIDDLSDCRGLFLLGRAGETYIGLYGAGKIERQIHEPGTCYEKAGSAADFDNMEMCVKNLDNAQGLIRQHQNEIIYFSNFKTPLLSVKQAKIVELPLCPCQWTADPGSAHPV